MIFCDCLSRIEQFFSKQDYVQTAWPSVRTVFTVTHFCVRKGNPKYSETLGSIRTCCHIVRVSILASFCVWTKSLKCKDVVNRDSTFQSLQVRRNSSSLSTVQTIEPSRPDAHLSTVPSVGTTCHPVQTLDRPASSIRTKCSFRPDPILYREVSVPACIRLDVSAACPDASQYSISF
jgi:hypothetical protein